MGGSSSLTSYDSTWEEDEDDSIVTVESSPIGSKEVIYPKMMKNNENVKRRLCEAYKLMLGFFGLQLMDELTGAVKRADNWQDRFRNLDSKSHNNLRITRILKSLGELGYEHYQEPLIMFYLVETLYHGNLKNVKRSVLDYFLFSVRDKKQRKELVYTAWKLYEPKAQFIWGPVEAFENDSRTSTKRTLSSYSNVVNSWEEISCCSCCCYKAK